MGCDNWWFTFIQGNFSDFPHLYPIGNEIHIVLFQFELRVDYSFIKLYVNYFHTMGFTLEILFKLCSWPISELKCIYLLVVHSKDSMYSPFCRQSHQVSKQWISILATCHKSSVYHSPKEKKITKRKIIFIQLQRQHSK